MSQQKTDTMKNKTIILIFITTIVFFACQQQEVNQQMIIKTIEITEFNAISAKVKGEIIDLGGGMTEYGVFYHTEPNAQTGQQLSLGKPTDIGEFIVIIENLQPGTKYYVCTYGIDKYTTVLGDEKSFITANGLPQINTTSITEISATTATIVGDISDNGGFEITARGVCYNTSSTPTIEDSKTENGNGTGQFSSNLTGLNSDTKYYLRLYAVNSIGTVYGNELIFFASDPVIDYDDNTYKTVKIGNQTWMSENLKTTHYPDGTEIPLVIDNTAWGNLGDNNTDDAYCYYNYSSANSNAYDALYTYAAAINACPTGWHLPTDNEWKQLEIYLGMSESEANDIGWRGTDEGKKLKATNSWFDVGNGTDDYGFAALPGGYRDYNNGTYSFIGKCGYWWSSTDDGNNYAYFRLLYFNANDMGRSNYYKSHGFSVRCIKDD